MNEAILAAKAIRLDILRLAFDAGKRGAHIAPSLSTADILAALFLRVMRFNAAINPPPPPTEALKRSICFKQRTRGFSLLRGYVSGGLDV
ncbi:MAG: hypothetical protein LBP89_02200 [Helicobacteraceae bacterium]|jgi:hypothetical protein|nr:hypothetical protein [Helicobacteraceae bacterium]